MKNLAKVILREEDFNVLKSFVTPTNTDENPMEVAYELGRAEVVKKDDLPAERVRIGSRETIEAIITKAKTTLDTVKPDQADIKRQRVSVLTPIASALSGLTKGDE